MTPASRLTVREACRRFDVSRPTLTRALLSGKVSGTRDDAGRWSIDAAELARVYAAKPAPGASPPPVADPPRPSAAAIMHDLERGRAAELEHELGLERARREVAEAVAAERLAMLEDLRGHLADLRLLLPPPRVPWWRRLGR